MAPMTLYWYMYITHMHVFMLSKILIQSHVQYLDAHMRNYIHLVANHRTMHVGCLLMRK